MRISARRNGDALRARVQVGDAAFGLDAGDLSQAGGQASRASKRMSADSALKSHTRGRRES